MHLYLELFKNINFSVLEITFGIFSNKVLTILCLNYFSKILFFTLKKSKNVDNIDILNLLSQTSEY